MEIFTRCSANLIKSLLGLILLCSASANAQVLLNEDFSTGSAYTPPAGWTNVSNTTGIDPWDFSDQCSYFNNGIGFDAGSTAMSGNIALMNTNCTEDFANADLISPAFDASTGGTYFLEFDNSINNYSAQFCQVNVWNGSAWVSVMTVDGADDGESSANHKYIDITTATGGSNQAKVRFHYEGDWEYWWAIDNVKITRVNCTLPTVAFSVAPDCNNNQFSVNANITNMGSATSLSLSDGTVTYGSPITTTGTYMAGPFAGGVAQTITLIHNNTDCNISQTLIYHCPPPNDSCEYATALSTTTSCSPVAGTTAGATISSPPVAASCMSIVAGNDVWFRFVATSTNATVKVSGLQSINPAAIYGEVRYSVYSGTCANLGSPIACKASSYNGNGATDDPLVLTGLTIGQGYFIRVHSGYASDVNYNDVITDYNFNICVKEEYPPANDNCANAMNIPVGSGLATTAVVSTTAFSTVENNMPGPSCISFMPPASDIWFKVTVPASGNVTIQSAAVSANMGLNVVMEAYSGACGSLTLIECDDNDNPDPSPSALHARIELTGQAAGAIIYIRIMPTTSSQYGPVAMTAWNPVMPVIADTGNCNAITPITIDSASGNLYRWVPIVNAAGKVIAEIYPNGNTLGTVNAGIFVNTGTVRQANGVYYLDRNVTITPANQPNSNVRVRLYALASELNALTTVDPAVTSFGSLNISKSQEGCQSAVNAATMQITQSGNQTFTDGANNNGGYVQFSTPSFSSFYLRGGSTPLPIVLKSITAKNTGASNRIDWTTLSETSTDYFELERSGDGRTFQYLSKITANGKPSDYVYHDEAPLAKDNYYRLKLLSNDGRSGYSKTVKAVSGSSETFVLEAYPNPVAGKVLVKVYGSENGRLSISDITGKVVLTTAMNGSESDIDMAKMAAGVYFIRYTDGRFSKAIKIMKQ